MANYTPSQVYDKYVALQKQLATNINNKGVTASQTELYDNLIDKVAQIENLKGEERTLENFTNVLDEPKSIVQLEYPEPKNLFDKSTLSGGLGVSEFTQTTNGFTFKTAATSTTMFVSSNIYLPAGTYYCSGTVTCSDTSYKGGWAVYDKANQTFIINAAARGTINSSFIITESKTYSLIFYAPYSAPVGVTMTFENVQLEKGSTATTYEPYPAPKTLNAKLGSKNLLTYPYTYTTREIKGVQWTVNADGTITATGTAAANSVFHVNDISKEANLKLTPGTTYTISSGLSTAISGVSIVCNYYPKDATAYAAWLNAATSRTGTFPNDGYSIVCYLLVLKDTTVENLVFKPQLELGSTATTYTPYISDFSTVNVIRCGKNLSHNLADRTDIFLTGTPTTVYSFSDNDIIKSFAVNGYATDYHITEFANNNGVITFKTSNVSYTAGVPVNVESGKTYTVSANIIGGVGGTAPIWISFMNNGLFVSYETKLTFTVPEGVNQGIFLIRPAAANSTCTFSNFQLELGSTATEYEPYSGQTYTPTSSGEVTGITNLYPLTTLVTNNAGVVFTEVTGGIYKEILPSTDKNGMTKVLQPAVDSTIDSNITSDNIKQGVNILGVTGDYICNYTYDETSKELVLLI